MSSILFAGILGCIPVIVHMLRRQQVTPIAWGAMQFLLESPLKSRRRRRIDNWLLMLVRIGIILLVAMLLSRPVVKNSRLATNTPIDVAVVIDHSLTMGMRSQGAGAGEQGGGAASGTLFEQGIAMTQQLAAMLPASGTMSVVAAENVPHVVTPTPVKMGITERDGDGTPRGEWATRLQTLRQMKPSMTKANIPNAIAEARELLSHSYNTRKMIVVISDQQRTNWEAGDESAWRLVSGGGGGGGGDASSLERPDAIPVYSLPVEGAGAMTTNVSVRAVTVMPAFLGVRRPAQIIATVTNSGSTDLTGIPVQLFVDGKMVTSQPLASLPAGESNTVRFDYYFPEPGSHWVRVHAEMIDALEADNAATAAVNVFPKLPVLIVDGQLTTGVARGGGGAGGSVEKDFPRSVFLVYAMQPIDPSLDANTLIDPRVVSVSEIGGAGGGGGGRSAGARGGASVAAGPVILEDYPVVVLNDVGRLPREVVDRLTAHVQRGNGVWIILGPRTESTFINDALAPSSLAPISTKGVAHAPTAGEGGAQGDVPAAVSVDIREPANPAVELLAINGQNLLSDVTLLSWWPVTTASAGMRTIAATTTGDPLILEADVGKSGGRVVVWTTSVGNQDWSNLPNAHNFMPLVNETLFHLASGQNSGQPRQLDAGAPLVWTGPASKPIESATLISPDGARRTLQPELRGDHYFVGDKETAIPGLYELRFSAPPTAGATAPEPAYFSVNIDRSELDPAVLSSADIEWFKSHGYLKSALTKTTLSQALGAQPGGYEIWWVLGIVLLGFLLLEVLMTYHLVRRQSGAALVEEGLDGALPGPATNSVQGAA